MFDKKVGMAWHVSIARRSFSFEVLHPFFFPRLFRVNFLSPFAYCILLSSYLHFFLCEHVISIW